MEFRVLGPLEVVGDGGVVVDLGAYRQRALLAMLLTEPNSVFSTDRIIDGLWGEEAAADRHNALWVYVSGLRKALEPGREKRSEGTVLLTRSPGYLVSLEPDQLDAMRFERRLTEGRTLVEADAEAASLLLTEALSMWRGRPYEDLTYESFFQPEILRLEELRVEAVEARIDADLARGMSRQLVSELESLVRDHPLRERFTGQLMLALYRSGRQADALRCYQSLRGRLGEELGIEPSHAIRRLEEQIITADAALTAPQRGSLTMPGTAPGLAVRGYELREELGRGELGVVYHAYQPGVGREVAIKVIRSEYADDPVFIRRFEAEAQSVARLEHPHIVPLYDYWREPGSAYLVMRYMKGGSLQSVLDESALTVDAAARMAERIGDALEAAHMAGVLHRDLRPSNILLDGEGNTYLADFGIAVGSGPAIASGRSSPPHTPPFVAPEARSEGEPSRASDVFSLGVIVAQALTGMSGEIAQIIGGVRPDVAAVVRRATDPDPAARHDTVASFVDDLARAVDARPRERLASVAENPYRGLRPFESADANVFFGRESLVDRLVYRLAEPGARSRFVAVVGPSGAGKSSVIKAGLLPALANGAIPLSDRWFTVSLVPAPHPFEELEEALRSIAIDPSASLLEQLTSGPRAFRRAVRRVLPDDGSQLLVFIDQFEELFTQVDPDTADRFLDVIVGAVTGEHSRVKIVISLRADYFDRPLRHRGLGALLREGSELITPMSPEEIERAITRPAARAGIEFDPALVAELINEVVDRPGALPLLQYTLTELFDARVNDIIGRDVYTKIGGLSGALATRAEGVLAGLGDAGRDVARQTFLRLVTLGEGAGDTRRRVLLRELEQLDVDRRQLSRFLDTFGRHRMLSFDRDPVTRGPAVEIAHEALLTEWARLREWIDAAREDVRNQRRVSTALAEWEASHRADDYLLAGPRLDQLVAWEADSGFPLSHPEREFLASSLEARDRAAAVEQQKEARRREAELSAARRVRQLRLVISLALVVALAGGFATSQWVVARRARSDAEAARSTLEEQQRSLALAARSVGLLVSDPELALFAALQSIDTTVESGLVQPGALDALHWAIQANHLVYPATADTPVAVRPGPDGPAGVFVLPVADLVGLARGALDPDLVPTYCAELDETGECFDPFREVPADLEIFGSAEVYGVVPGGGAALAGTSLELLGGFVPDPGLFAELDRFEELTGIAVSYQQASVAFELSRRASAELDLPELIASPQPARTADLVSRFGVVPLDTYLDDDSLRRDFGDYLLSLATLGTDGTWPAHEGTVYAVPMDVDLKGLIYYPRLAFEQAGYSIPGDLDELLELSERIAADGGTPWCVAFESGPASGWPGTDWLESIVIRTAGPEVYEAWTYHEIPFDAPEIREAGRMLERFLLTPGFVRGGPSVILGQYYLEPMSALMARDAATDEPRPQCWLFHQADFLLGQAPPGTRIGSDLDVFLMPPGEGSQQSPATGGGSFLSATADRPEVRAFVEFVASGEFGVEWASGGLGQFVSPHASFDVSNYRLGSEERSVHRNIAIAVRDALAADAWRFDASDLMPGAIGSFAADGRRGAFWTAMIELIGTPRSMDELLTELEANWLALEASEP